MKHGLTTADQIKITALSLGATTSLLPSRAYRVLTWVAQNAIPGTVVLIGSVGAAVDWDGTGAAVAITGAVGLWLARLLGAGEKNYDTVIKEK